MLPRLWLGLPVRAVVGKCILMMLDLMMKRATVLIEHRVNGDTIGANGGIYIQS